MFLVGEALTGDGNEVAHIDLLVGEKSGPVGQAFASALATQTEGHTVLLAVIAPNLLTKPATVLVPKVDIRSLDQATLMFGPAQSAVGKAVADSVDEGVIPRDKIEELCIICGVFIHPAASNKKKIYDFNYEATKLAVKRAFAKEPTLKEVLEKKEKAVHPFRGF